MPQAMTVRLNLHSGFVFDALPRWDELFRMPVAERMQKLRDPGYRKHLDEGAHSEARRHAPVPRALAEPARGRDVRGGQRGASPARRSARSREAEGKAPFDAFLDLAIADELKTSFMPAASTDSEADWQARGRVWHDDRTVIGASDAGAHLDMIDTFAIPTQVLGNGVRRHGVVSLEEAVHQLTDVPARLYGLRERGRLAQGWRADVTVFDADAVGSGPTYTRYDLPAGAGRLYADADGIEHVLVNGVEIVRGGEHTGALPGTVLRSGRDTRHGRKCPGGRRS